VSLVANGSAFLDALGLIRKNPALGVGIHLCLAGEKAILHKGKIVSLADDKGYLPKSHAHFLRKIMSRKINLSEAELELEAQIRKVIDSGIVPTHIDCHQYIYFIPSIFEIVLRLIRKYGIKWMRYPREAKSQAGFSFKNYLKKAYLFFNCARQLQLLSDNGIRCPDSSFGLMTCGCINEQRLKEFLRVLPCGVNDITCHPGCVPEDKKYLAWKYSWEAELNALTSEQTKGLLRSLNIKLINYAE
jgi:predicted glycoside hydrolase/deacetylase ChbG (UPF0249 family)